MRNPTAPCVTFPSLLSLWVFLLCVCVCVRRWRRRCCRCCCWPLASGVCGGAGHVHSDTSVNLCGLFFLFFSCPTRPGLIPFYFVAGASRSRWLWVLFMLGLCSVVWETWTWRFRDSELRIGQSVDSCGCVWVCDFSLVFCSGCVWVLGHYAISYHPTLPIFSCLIFVFPPPLLREFGNERREREEERERREGGS